jgi:putative peptidoglycan lipid II flippase
MKKTLRFSFGLVFLVSLPALAGLLVLSRPIIRVLFERGHFSGQSTAISASCLFYFALGLPFISGVKILAPAFYSLKDTKTPMIIAVIVMLSCIGLSLLLMPPLRAGGIALAISLSQIINLFLLVVYLEKKVGSIGKKDILGSALRSGFCAAVMGAAVWLLARLWESRLMSFAEQAVALLGTIFLGLAVYAATSFFFNRQDLRSVRVAFSPGKIFREKDGK